MPSKQPSNYLVSHEASSTLKSLHYGNFSYSFHRFFRNHDQLAKIIRNFELPGWRERGTYEAMAQSPACTWLVLTCEVDFQFGVFTLPERTEHLFPELSGCWLLLEKPSGNPCHRYNPRPLNGLLNPQVSTHGIPHTLWSWDRFHRRFSL